MSSRGGDLIAPEAYPVLVMYCRAVSLADEIAAAIEEIGASPRKQAKTLQRWSILQAMQDRQARGVALLADKLRLTPQTRQSQAKAGRNAAKGEKYRPWKDED
jgi:phage terminase small subunit